MERFTLIQRRNQRLNDAYRPVMRPHIAPRLQIMRLWDMPMAEGGGLIVIQALLHPQRHFVHCLIEFQIGRRSLNRIGPQNEKHIHAAAVHVIHKLFQRSHRLLLMCLHRLVISHRLANIPQGIVHRMRQRMHHRRLECSRDHNARPIGRPKISNHFFQPFRLCPRQFATFRTDDPQSLAHLPRQPLDLPRQYAHPMIRHRPRDARCALRHIQPRHLRLRFNS